MVTIWQNKDLNRKFIVSNGKAFPAQDFVYDPCDGTYTVTDKWTASGVTVDYVTDTHAALQVTNISTSDAWSTKDPIGKVDFAFWNTMYATAGSNAYPQISSIALQGGDGVNAWKTIVTYFPQIMNRTNVIQTINNVSMVNAMWSGTNLIYRSLEPAIDYLGLLGNFSTEMKNWDSANNNYPRVVDFSGYNLSNFRLNFVSSLDQQPSGAHTSVSSFASPILLGRMYRDV